jgi:glycosyltransferase involved in cell wall biosynthesis
LRLQSITPLIITYNEEANIRRVLARLDWAHRVIVVDSGSTDATLAILRADPRVEVLHRSFDTFAEQCNFGLGHVDTEWALSLDADYVCSNALIDEIRGLPDDSEITGFTVAFRYCVFGRRLRSTLYPVRTVLFRRRHAHYVADGHAHALVIEGRVTRLNGTIDHDDRKPLSVWLRAQSTYARIEADKILDNRRLPPSDRLRRLRVVVPLLMPFYCLVIRGLLLDGWPGWYYTAQRTYAEWLLSLELTARALERATSRTVSD